ncbi:flavin reductase family protein [Ruminococcus sp. HUN007]|uniref:flavin reductase family protein n=1 Tax=Ruminococcus sp. HUN007 TaxID=1514668 RepID=UPI0005D2C34B|nr:flavin reductase family protein [Ruminococcus sp. HUN007]
MSLVKTSIESLKVNPFELIGRDWFLITSGTSVSDYNTMTASWGSMGIMWGKPVFTCGIRHNRYTFEFSEKNDLITFSFFDSDKYRPMLNFCGSKSGRDHDKAKETGITPVEIDGTVSFGEARLVLVCRKLYAQDLEKDKFTDSSLLKFYENDPVHRMYTSEIVAVYENK